MRRNKCGPDMFWWKRDNRPQVWSVPRRDKIKPKAKPAPRNPLENPWEFGRWLKKRNFRNLGNGSFASVYGKKGSDRVIKIGHRANDDGWIEYALWSNENGFGGTLAPKVYSYKRYGTFYVAVMERLEDAYEDPEGNVKVMADIAYHGLVKKNGLANNLCELLDIRWKAFYDGFTNKFGNRRIDWHEGNFMQRPSTGEFVLTDPLASHKSTVRTVRWKAESSRPTTLLFGRLTCML